MFYPPTCVGLRYGRGGASLRGFSGGRGDTGFAIGLRPAPGHHGGGFACPRLARHHGDVQNPAPAPPTRRPVGRTAPPRCRNLGLLRFGYASRPRLSPRLTLGGLASPRKPRVFGARVSHPRLATHASILTPRRSTVGRPPASPRRGRSPTDITCISRRFGCMLSPVYCRRASTRPVSCYALFEGVAASEPTSWLSARTHILCHSACNWGPWRAVRAVSLSSARLSPRDLTAALWTLGHSEFGSARQAVRPPRRSGALPPGVNGRR